MPAFGYGLIIGAFVLTVVATLTLAVGALTGRQGLQRLGRFATLLCFGLVTVASLLLIFAFLSDDFSIRYVALRSRFDQALIYKLGAFWAGQEGSMLLWLWVLQGYSAYLAWTTRRETRPLFPLAIGIMNSIGVFFASLMVFTANPFATLSPVPFDGDGLNPLLADPYMMTHPVGLYLGYIGMSVPYAFGMAALWLREPSDSWLRVTRRWTLTAWTLLSIGIFLGARWAYHVLGWGGYWDWDPVENASFLPWLTAIAFIHSSMVQETRRMFKGWNMGLIIITFILTIFGTFLVRSGILSSVHAFAESDVGHWFMVYIGIMIAVSVYFYLSRRDTMRDEGTLTNYTSKEASFLGGNIVLLASAFAILLGTVLPLVTKLFGQEVTVGAPYFNRVTGPLFFLLLVLMALSPALAWGRTSAKAMRRSFFVPLIGSVLFGLLLAVLGIGKIAVLLGLTSALFMTWILVAEVWRAAQARRDLTGEPLGRATWQLMNRNPRRYGGYVVHLAIVLVTIGISASWFYQDEVVQTLRLGETMRAGAVELTYLGLDAEARPDYTSLYATLDVSRNGRHLGTMLPEKRFYPGFSEREGPITPAALRVTPLQDIYVRLGSSTSDGSQAVFQVFVNPLVFWIWAGGFLLVGGTVFAVWPRAVHLRADTRLTEEERVFARLRDLEYDFRMGKLEQAEYAVAREALAAEASVVLDAQQQAEARVEAELQQRLGAAVSG